MCIGGTVMSDRIPKIIHYCWFGNVKKSAFIKKCIATWKKYLPEYRIIEWNETNFSTEYNEYVRQAYENKKYAFVSDVARLYALYTYGGVYFDTDIEVKKSLNEYLNAANVLMAFESNKVVMTGFMASTEKNPFIKEWLDSYRNIRFILPNGEIDSTPNTFRVTSLLKNKGLVLSGKKQEIEGRILIFEKEIFGAYDVDNSSFVADENTVIIHHCTNSWMPMSYKIKDSVRRNLAKILGRDRYARLKGLIKHGK